MPGESSTSCVTCPYCGKTNKPGALWCWVCHGPLTEEARIAALQMASGEPRSGPSPASAVASALAIGCATIGSLPLGFVLAALVFLYCVVVALREICTLLPGQ